MKNKVFFLALFESCHPFLLLLLLHRCCLLFWLKVLFIKKEAVALHLTTPQTLQSALVLFLAFLGGGSKCIKNSLSWQNLKEQQKTATRTTTVNRPICSLASWLTACLGANKAVWEFFHGHRKEPDSVQEPNEQTKSNPKTKTLNCKLRQRYTHRRLPALAGHNLCTYSNRKRWANFPRSWPNRRTPDRSCCHGRYYLGNC